MSFGTRWVKRRLAAALQSQLSLLIEDINLEGLGLTGGDVVLEHLSLRRDLVRNFLGVERANFDVVSGFIRELRIAIPWTSLLSSPVEIQIDSVEIVVAPISPMTLYDFA